MTDFDPAFTILPDTGVMKGRRQGLAISGSAAIALGLISAPTGSHPIPAVDRAPEVIDGESYDYVEQKLIERLVEEAPHDPQARAALEHIGYEPPEAV